MRTPPRRRQPMDQEAAETLGAEGLAFLAEEPARLQRFFLATGLEPGDSHASPRYRRTVSRNVPIEIGLEM